MSWGARVTQLLVPCLPVTKKDADQGDDVQDAGEHEGRDNDLIRSDQELLMRR
jgi:hypothetical protein